MLTKLNAKLRGRGRLVKGLLSVTFSALAVAALLAEDNVCCGCNEEGCSNNWVCAEVVGLEIGGCCGMGEGQVFCGAAEAGEFCVICENGRVCGNCVLE